MDDQPAATRAAASERHGRLFNYRPLTAAELRGYEEQGCLVLRSVLTPSGVRRLVDECMTAWTAEKGPYDPRATWLENALLVLAEARKSPFREAVSLALARAVTPAPGTGRRRAGGPRHAGPGPRQPAAPTRPGMTDAHSGMLPGAVLR